MKKVIFIFALFLISFFSSAEEIFNKLPYSVKVGDLFSQVEVTSYVSNYGKVYFAFEGKNLDSYTKIEVHYKKIGHKQDSVVIFKGLKDQSVSLHYLKSMSENCFGVYINGRNCGGGKKFNEFCKAVYDAYFPIYKEVEQGKIESIESIKKCASEISAKRDSINNILDLIETAKDSLVIAYKAETERLRDSLKTENANVNKRQIEMFNESVNEYEEKIGINNIKRVKAIVDDINFELGYSNSVGGHDFDFSFTNNSKKTIKYYYINLTFRNAVGDLCHDEIRGFSNTTLSGIGPIEGGCSEYGGWGVVIYDEWAEKAVINSFKIVYMDGSSITLSGKDVMNIVNYPKMPTPIKFDIDNMLYNGIGRFTADYLIKREIEKSPIIKNLVDNKYRLIEDAENLELNLNALINSCSNKYGFSIAQLKKYTR